MGFNSLSISTEETTYFGLIKGANSVSFGVPAASILRFYQDGELYAGALVLTVTEGANSYSVNFEGGKTPFYEIDGGAVNISISDGESGGSVTTTPTGFTDFNISFVSYKIRAKKDGRFSAFSNTKNVFCLEEII